MTECWMCALWGQPGIEAVGKSTEKNALGEIVDLCRECMDDPERHDEAERERIRLKYMHLRPDHFNTLRRLPLDTSGTG